MLPMMVPNVLMVCLLSRALTVRKLSTVWGRIWMPTRMERLVLRST